MDLKKNYEDIWSDYNRHTRKNIKKAKREGLEVFRSDNALKDINKFTEIYQASMDQKEAKKFYYFNEEFFKNLASWFKEELSLFFVEYKNEIITASLELGKYGILHDYLRGTNPKFNSLRPTELLLDEIAKWSKKNGYNTLVLGGGRTNSEDDNLLRFKKKISPTIIDYFLYKKIHDLETYKMVCKIKGLNNNLKFENASFFPEYNK
jgi:lipid II:glycine glycyltransferase (peptidoglycan interpeptide bridge formation enzyme)